MPDDDNEDVLEETVDAACEGQLDGFGRRLGGRTAFAVYQFDSVDNEPDPETERRVARGGEGDADETMDESGVSYENEPREDAPEIRGEEEPQAGEANVPVRPEGWLPPKTLGAELLDGFMMASNIVGPNGKSYSDKEIKDMLEQFSGSTFSTNDAQASELRRAAVDGVPPSGSGSGVRDPGMGDRMCSFQDGKRVCSASVRELIRDNLGDATTGRAVEPREVSL
jgi:hypothetical protein